MHMYTQICTFIRYIYSCDHHTDAKVAQGRVFWMVSNPEIFI